MKNKPTFSIITVCLNSHNLRQTCDSIVNQTYQDFEWIVIDGGSNEHTMDILNQYRDRMNFFVSEKDTGIYNAMNKGIKQAHGEYLLFMNGGDFLDSPYSLERFVEEGLDKDIIYANLRLYSYGYANICQENLDADFWIRTTLPHQSTIIRKELFDKYGLYNENYKIASDYEKWIEFIHVNKCTYKHLNFIASCFDCTGISCTNSNSVNERYDVLCKYFSKSELNKITNKRLSLVQKIFSIMPWMVNRNYLAITVFGFRFLLKRKK